MSLLENILGGLFGQNDEGSTAKPCSNCPSDCKLCPTACEVCRPYKEKLIEQLYDVEHREEYYARYEVASAASPTEGMLTCPYCGGQNPASAVACDYCGSQLKESSGKIRVASAKDIPDPLQTAQDTIFRRREAVSQFEQSGGILEGLANLFGGEKDDFGDRMSDDELEAMAKAYGVSLAAYLQGLDNGKYLTASARAAGGYATGAAAGAGILGGAALGSSLLNHHAKPAPRPGRPPLPPTHRPARPGRRDQRHTFAGQISPRTGLPPEHQASDRPSAGSARPDARPMNGAHPTSGGHSIGGMRPNGGGHSTGGSRPAGGLHSKGDSHSMGGKRPTGGSRPAGGTRGGNRPTGGARRDPNTPHRGKK